MNQEWITPLEKVTPGYWWVRDPETVPYGAQPGTLKGPGPWHIVQVKGESPFLYIGVFLSENCGGGMRWEMLNEPHRIQFGIKILEMPEGL